MTQLARKFTLTDLRLARAQGTKIPMLTCYDFTTARVMQDAGVSMLLVGDSAASVILGHDSTLPIGLPFMIELTAAVRRGAPLCLVVADMPFGSYGGDARRGFRNVVRMMKLSGCDCVKLEAGTEHLNLIQELAGIGVAVMAHLGLRPQSVGMYGSYKARGRTAAEAIEIVNLAVAAQQAGAVAILLEAVPPEVSQAVVNQTSIPVIGCGAGPACHGHVVVTQDALLLTPHRPKFVPTIGDVAEVLKQSFTRYVSMVSDGSYPASEHCYEMPADEKRRFDARQGNRLVEE